jgi:hypothetical protein
LVPGGVVPHGEEITPFRAEVDSEADNNRRDDDQDEAAMDNLPRS